MSKLRFSSEYKDGKHKLKVELLTYLWKDEDGIHYAYSPSLDLTGYGKTEDEAKKSFETTLAEFISYTHHKGTLFEELEHLGWAVNRKKKRVHAPDLNELLEDNDELRSLIERGNVTTEKRSVELEPA